jgi:hypothetical protein
MKPLERADFVTSFLVAALVSCGACTRHEPTPAGGTPPSATATPPSTIATTAATSATVALVLTAPDAEACPRPLGQFCKDFPCDYEGLRAYAKKFERCTRGESGTCGANRYVLFEAYDGGYVVYFDASGRAIGVGSHSDVIFPGQCWTYGAVPTCEKKRVEHLCGLKPGQHSE